MLKDLAFKTQKYCSSFLLLWPTLPGWQQWPLNSVACSPAETGGQHSQKAFTGISLWQWDGWKTPLILNKLYVLGFNCNHVSWGFEDMRSPSVFGCQFSLGVFDNTTLNEMFSKNNLLTLFACCCIYWRTVLLSQFTRFFPFQILVIRFPSTLFLKLTKNEVFSPSLLRYLWRNYVCNFIPIFTKVIKQKCWSCRNDTMTPSSVFISVSWTSTCRNHEVLSAAAADWRIIGVEL